MEERLNELVNYFAPEYPQMQPGELKTWLTSDANAMDSALQLYHEDVYSDRDYQTFRTQFFTPPEQTPGQKEETATGQGAFTLQPGALPTTPQETSRSVWGRDLVGNLAATANVREQTDKTNAFANIPIFDPNEFVPDDTKPSIAPEDTYSMAQRIIDEELAIKSIQDRRRGDYETPADEKNLPLNTDGDQVFTQDQTNMHRRLQRRTPMERYLGTQKGEETISGFSARQLAISDENKNLATAVGYLDNKIASAHGDDWMEFIQKKPENEADIERFNSIVTDPLIEERDKFTNLHNINEKRVRSMLNDPEFASVKKYVDAVELKQQNIDDGKLIGFGDNLYFAKATLKPILRAISRTVLNSTSALMDVAEQYTYNGDTKYGAWDMMEDFLRDSNKDLERFLLPIPTSGEQGVISTVGRYDMNGTELDITFDGKGEIVDTRDPKTGNLVKTMLSQDDVEKIKKIPKKRRVNPSAVWYQGVEMATDLGLQVLATRGIGGALTKAGMPVQAASTLGLTLATTGMMIDPMYESMKEEFGDGRKAATAALMASVGIGLAANAFGMEKTLAGFGPDKLAVVGKKGMQQAIKGAYKTAGIGAVAATAAKSFFKEGMGEVLEETVFESLVQNGVRGLFGGSPTEWSTDEFLSTAMMSFALGSVGGGAGGLSIKSHPDSKQAFAHLAQNYKNFEPALREAISNGVVKPDKDQTVDEFISQESDRISDIGKVLVSVNEQRDGYDKGIMVEFLDARRNYLQYAERMKDLGASPEVMEKIEIKKNALNDKLFNFINGGTKVPIETIPSPTPKQKFVKPKVENTSPTVEELAGEDVSFRGHRGTIEMRDDVPTFVGEGIEETFDPGIRAIDEGIKSYDGEFLTSAPTSTIVDLEPTISKPSEPIFEPLPEDEESFDDGAPLTYEVGEPTPDQSAIAESLYEDVNVIEAAMEEVEDPQIQEALAEFRALPEHPDNMDSSDPNEEQMVESFEGHKEALVEELTEYAGEAADIRESDPSPMTEIDDIITEAETAIAPVEDSIDVTNWDQRTLGQVESDKAGLNDEIRKIESEKEEMAAILDMESDMDDDLFNDDNSYRQDVLEPYNRAIRKAKAQQSALDEIIAKKKKCKNG